ncbi:peptidoglycan DD-metalloendopeptidase family protein [Gordonia sp. CPCC 205515]|uniref:peptidoglycan DD-metalloendopeptidase family protein n=1 Tax=Gordonia sp. CPCC 205515 TaxID=3140791 RepID=UPI003AF366B8
MFSATVSILMMLWRHKEKVAAVAMIFLMAIAMKIDLDNQAQNNCGATTTPSAEGGGGVVVDGDYAYPADKSATSVSSPYGMRGGEFHRGIDIAGPEGTPIYAFAEGTVADAGPASGFGYWIVVDHTFGGKRYSTVYGHMWANGVLVRTGDRVTAGQRIALIGNNGQSSGAHLHFEVWNGGRIPETTAVDPAPWLAQAEEGRPARPGPAAEPDAPRPPPEDSTDPSVLRARQIIDVGHRRGMPEQVIHSGLATGLVESNLRNLASEAVPESKQYPNDGIAPGDHDSVGIFQQRRSTQSAGVDTKTAMDPVWQINTYYDYVEKQPGWRTADPGELAADVQGPREDLRGKYAERMPEATALYATYGASADGAAGEGCTTPDGEMTGPSGPAGDLARKAVSAAMSVRGKPYIWGGEGPDGYDCSGLIRYAYLTASGGAISLPHYTGDSGNPGLLAVGAEVPSQSDLQPGDIILYNGSRTQAAHVGLYIGDGQIVHAPQEGDVVKVGPISQGGTVVMMRRIDTAPSQPDMPSPLDSTPTSSPATPQDRP